MLFFFAGSEKLRDTQTNNDQHQIESNNINKSLLVLGTNCNTPNIVCRVLFSE